MIQVHTKYKRTERFYSTRMSALDVLAQLGAALRDNLHYMQLLPRLEAYDVTLNPTLPVVRIRADGPRLSDHDSVEVLFYAGSEHFTLGEISDRFPGGIVAPCSKEIEQAAFEWSTDYKPWEEGLPYIDYARQGFVEGAKWARK